MAASTWTPGLVSLKDQAPRLVAHAPEPHAELLALVWGPRFDRDHAQALAASAGLALQPLEQAAREFDALSRAAQQRLRALILRHYRRWENAATLH
ncbi:MAG: hypothetical protein E6Q78_09580 [Rhodoferax sp.]|nr:MAG: hypothetical protein E6Q78_09580 [Rhodoferax sp.]